MRSYRMDGTGSNWRKYTYPEWIHDVSFFHKLELQQQLFSRFEGGKMVIK